MGILRTIERTIRSGLLRLLTASARQEESPSERPTPERILIIRVDRIGDAIVSTPTVRLLRTAFPGSRIDMLLGEKNRAIASLLPFVDNVMVWERRPGRLLAVVGRLRRGRYDLVINLHTDRSSNAETAAAIAAGTHTIRAHEVDGIESGHIVPAVARSLERLGIEISGLTESELQMQLLIPGAFGCDPDGPIGLNVSCRDPERRWPINSYRRLIGRLNTAGDRVVVLAEPTDRGLAESVVPEGLSVPVETREGLMDYLRLLQTCSILISPDSGAVHMAAACGVPVVGLYASDAKERRWRPWGVPNVTLVGDRSVATIPVADVLKSIERMRGRLIKDEAESDA